MSRPRMQKSGAVSRVRARSLLASFLDGREDRQPPEIPESSNRPVPGPVTNYRRLLRRYIEWVKMCKGVDFLIAYEDKWAEPPGRHFSHEEWEVLKELSDENHQTTKKTIEIESGSGIPGGQPSSESAETGPEV